MTLVVKVTDGGEPTRNDLVLSQGATELHQTCEGNKVGGGGEINYQAQLLFMEHADL